MDDLLHIEGQVCPVIRIFVHILLRLVQFLLRCILRWNEYINQLIHQLCILILMLHGKHIELILHGIRQLGRMDLQRIVHEHLIESPIGSLILRDDKLILILPEIQPADNPIQFILPLIGLPDRASDLEDKVVLEMLHRRARLLLRRLPEHFQIVAGKRF